jgi:hypothetical protein
MTSRGRWRWLRWVIAGAVVVVILAVAGPFIFFHFVEATIHTDSAQRDAQFDGRIMDVATYPTGTFALTKPIDLAPVPAAGTIKTYTATGKLTLHGQSVPVTFPLKAERTANGIEVQGSIPVLFSA